MNELSVFILGAGGHAKVLIDSLKQEKQVKVLGILDLNEALYGKTILGIPILGSEDMLENCPPSNVRLINGIGSIHSQGIKIRANIFNKFKEKGFEFLNVIHATAYFGQEVKLGEGVQVFARATIQTGAYIGNNVIVNTNASIDHDCIIEDHVHLAPGVVCCGGVTIGQGSHIGTGAVILQGINIGENCLVAAGAVVTQDVVAENTVVGIPAKIMERKNEGREAELA